MSFPEYVKKSELLGKKLWLSNQPPLRTPKGLFELYIDIYEKAPDGAVANEEGYVIAKEVVCLATLQDISWIYHKRTSKYFTAIQDPKNPRWCNFADL